MEKFLKLEEKITTVNCLLELMKSYCEQNFVENDLSVLKIVLDLTIKEQSILQRELDETIKNLTIV